MNKLKTVETVITEKQMMALKEKTGETSNKDALAKAVYHFIECEYLEGQ